MTTPHLDDAKKALTGWLWFKPTGEAKAALEGDNVDVIRQISSLIESPFVSCGLGRRHTTKIDSKAGEWTNELRRLIGMLGNGVVAALVGPRGTGKTQMAAYAIRHCIERDPTNATGAAKYTNWCEIVRSIKATFGKDGGMTEDDIIAQLVKYRLLVIDEVHEGRGTDFEAGLFTAIVDARYREMKDTILISNQERAAFSSTVGDSVSSRMLEGGGIISMNWESFRGTNGDTR
jgi:DNA replication protein DnaC